MQYTQDLQYDDLKFYVRHHAGNKSAPKLNAGNTTLRNWLNAQVQHISLSEYNNWSDVRLRQALPKGRRFDINSNMKHKHEMNRHDLILAVGVFSKEILDMANKDMVIVTSNANFKFRPKRERSRQLMGQKQQILISHKHITETIVNILRDWCNGDVSSDNFHTIQNFIFDHGTLITTHIDRFAVDIVKLETKFNTL